MEDEGQEIEYRYPQDEHEGFEDEGFEDDGEMYDGAAQDAQEQEGVFVEDDDLRAAADEEALRKQQKPAVDVEQAVQLAEELFGLSVSDFEEVKELDSYDDRNFFMSGSMPDGTSGSFTLKVHNGVESENMDILDCQNAVLAFLAGEHLKGQLENFDIAEERLKLQVPMPQLSLNREYTAFKDISPASLDEEEDEEYDRPEGEAMRHAVRLLAWVEGTPMSTLDPKPNQMLLFKAGQYLANMTNILQDFDHIGAHRNHSWDLNNTPSILAHLHCIEDDSRRSLVESVVESFEAMGDWQQSVPWGVLQADYNDANLILDDGLTEEERQAREEDPKLRRKKLKYEIAGVIDFGDVVYSCLVNDLAIAMAYHMLGHQNPIQAAAALYSGYCSVRQLLPAEQKVLYTLVACRLAISVTNGALSYQQEPENEYLLFHAQPAWDALENWWQKTSKEEIEVELAGAVVTNAYGNVKDK